MTDDQRRPRKKKRVATVSFDEVVPCSPSPSPPPLSTKAVKRGGRDDDDERWLETATPSDLSIHSTKWTGLLNCITGQSSSRIVLLTGPSGCGKRSAVTVAARISRMQLFEWTLTDATLDDCSQDNMPSWKRREKEDDEESKCLAGFLAGVARTGTSSTTTERIILLRSLPNEMWKQPSQLTSMLRSFLADVRFYSTRLVFSLALDSNASYEYSPFRLFTSTLCTKFDVSRFSLPPIARTYMTTALSRFGAKIGLSSSQVDIKKYVEDANGNIRRAIISLRHELLGRHSSGDRPALKRSRSSSASLNGGRSTKSSTSSTQMDVFHLIGVLLHANRLRSPHAIETEAEPGWKEDALEWGRIERQLEPCTSRQRPHPPKRNINRLIDLDLLSIHQLSLFIYEHGAPFAPSLASLRRQRSILAICDSAAEWQTRTGLERYSNMMSQMVARTLYYEHYRSADEKPKGRFTSFGASEWPTLCGAAETTAHPVREAHRANTHRLLTDHDLFGEVVPMLANMQWTLCPEAAYAARTLTAGRRGEPFVDWRFDRNSWEIRNNTTQTVKHRLELTEPSITLSQITSADTNGCTDGGDTRADESWDDEIEEHDENYEIEEVSDDELDSFHAATSATRR